MKIITKDAVYVQKHDIAFLTHTDLEFPASIFNKVFGNGTVIINDSNRWEFIKFEKEEDIKFFKEQDWIIDYNDVKDLSDEQFAEMGCAVVEKKNDIAKIYNGMSEKERKENMDMVYRCERLDHKMYSLRDILWFKQGHLKMDLPIVPDLKGFSFIGDDECKYEIRASLDPNKLLLFRKDGNKLTDSDRIPQGFIETGMSIAIMNHNEKDKFCGDYEISKYLTEDSKYLVIEFKAKNHEEKVEEESKTKKLLKRIKNILKK